MTSFTKDDDENLRILSIDLKNATYNMSHDLLEQNTKLFDIAMEQFPVWTCFHKLFKIHKRTVDLSVLQQQGYIDPDISPTMETLTGSFMGDALSFIHLTVTMLSIVEQTVLELNDFKPRDCINKNVHVKRPLGQSVGDDVVILNVTPEFCAKFEEITARIGLVISKIQSKSSDSGTFCEQYLYRLTREESLANKGLYSPNTLFGDILFLDVFKGSIFSGKSKIKQDGGNPLIGHAKMLQKQIAWMPPSLVYKKQRSKSLLWTRHYRQVAGISRALPSLPSYLGGLEIAVGRELSLYDESLRKSYLPYYYAILKAPSQEDFLIGLELLLGIWRSSGKGFPYEVTDEQLIKVFEQVQIKSQDEVFQLLPDYAQEWTPSAKRELLSRRHGLLPLSQIGSEMVRRDAFLQWWLGKAPEKKVSMLLDPKRFLQKHRENWSKIREIFEPESKPFEITSLTTLSQKLEARLHNQFFDREDPAIREAFLNMPSLFVSLRSNLTNGSLLRY